MGVSKTTNKYECCSMICQKIPREQMSVLGFQNSQFPMFKREYAEVSPLYIPSWFHKVMHSSTFSLWLKPCLFPPPCRKGGGDGVILIKAWFFAYWKLKVIYFNLFLVDQFVYGTLKSLLSQEWIFELSWFFCMLIVMQ